MMEKAVAGGLAGLWAWTVLNDDEGILRKQHAWLLKYNDTRKWMQCPWCSGAWFAGAAVYLLSFRLSKKAVVAAAAAGITGLIGSYLEGA